MKRETKKALAKRTATVLAAAAGAGVLSPLAGDVAERAFEALSKSNASRVRELFDHALRGDDAEELAARLNRAFLEDDPEVVATFIQAGRAAMEAVEPAAVPSIGLLFRRALAENAERLPRWQMRAYLRTLEEVTAEELGDLREFVHGVLRAPALLKEPRRMAVPVAAFSRRDGRWDVMTDLVGASPKERKRLCTIQDAEQTFRLLVHQRLADDRDEPLSIAIDLAVIRPLAEVMPTENAAP